MRGVEFRLGHNDHKIIERFIEGKPTGVAGIVVDATKLHRHKLAIEAARAAQVQVRVEPLTERLSVAGYDGSALGYADSYPIEPLTGLTKPMARDEVVDRVITRQMDVADELVPPHFFVDTAGTGTAMTDLNIDLARRAVRRFPKPVRAIMTVQREFLLNEASPSLIAARYRDAGIERLDLRITPLGSHADGPVKVRTALGIIEAFQSAGLRVCLGHQGLLGEVAASLSLVDAYMVGIGLREKLDVKSALRTQAKRTGQEASEGRPRTPDPYVYVRQAAALLPRKVALAMFQDRSVRSDLLCRHHECSASIDAPVTKRREHYLHTRAADAAQVQDQPPQWRPNLMRERLDASLSVRQRINAHLPPGATQLKPNLIEAAIDELSRRIDDAIAA